jgi:hypothetical protein
MVVGVESIFVVLMVFVFFVWFYFANGDYFFKSVAPQRLCWTCLLQAPVADQMKTGAPTRVGPWVEVVSGIGLLHRSNERWIGQIYLAIDFVHMILALHSHRNSRFFQGSVD